MLAKRSPEGLFFSHVPLDSEEPVVPHGVVPPQLYPDLGSNIDSETSLAT